MAQNHRDAAGRNACPGLLKATGGACSGPSFLQALLRSARLGGGSAMLLRAALAAQAGRVSRALAVRSGVEMRAARRTAERVGAQMVLGERPPSSVSASCQVRL